MTKTDFVSGSFGGMGKQLLNLMLWVIKDALAQVYLAEGNFKLTEWFCLNLLGLHFAKQEKPAFLLAKYQALYVKYLKHTKQWSEALSQARCLESFLTEEFGEDYLSWLPGAPNASELCSDLEKKVQYT